MDDVAAMVHQLASIHPVTLSATDVVVADDAKFPVASLPGW